MQNSDVIKAQLALYAFNEGKSYGGSRAAEQIAWCMANRVRNGMNDWAGMLNAADKYRQSAEPLRMEMPNIWDAGFLALVQSIDDIYGNRGRDLSCGAIFYADPSKPMTDFFRENIVRNPSLKPLVQMPGLILYGAKQELPELGTVGMRETTAKW